MSEKSILEEAIEKVEEIDTSMTKHAAKCKECIDHGACKEWVDLVETYNFYNLAMIRYTKNTMTNLVPPGYSV